MYRAFVWVALLLGSLSLIPFALIARARVTTSEKPRIHIIRDMDYQEKLKPQQASPLFADVSEAAAVRIRRAPVERGGLPCLAIRADLPADPDRGAHACAPAAALTRGGFKPTARSKRW